MLLPLLASLAMCISGCGGAGTPGTPGTPGPATPSQQSSGLPWFENIVASSGIDFRHENGYKDEYLSPENFGGRHRDA